MVRMGELAVSGTAGDVLVSLGLGSCIGLALTDRRMGIAGLAHIVLPDSHGETPANPRKYADLAIPEMVAELEALGARRIRLQGVLVGGASMFGTAPHAPGGSTADVNSWRSATRSAAGLEVGQRNETAVRDQLTALRIPVVAAATGGSKGRTVRVDVATAGVTVREAGGVEHDLVADAMHGGATFATGSTSHAGLAGACGAGVA